MVRVMEKLLGIKTPVIIDLRTKREYRFPGGKREVWIGRGKGCDVVVDRPYISRKQARIYYSGGFLNRVYQIEEDKNNRLGLGIRRVDIRGNVEEFEVTHGRVLEDKDIILLAYHRKVRVKERDIGIAERRKPYELEFRLG